MLQKIPFAVLFFIISLITAGLAQAQNTLEGEVVDSRTGEPLFGVSVLDINAGTGTSTDLDGKFTITYSGTTTLRFSFIGYRTVDIEVTPSTSDLTVDLEQEISALDEVVVTGLGTSIKRENLANSITRIDSDKLTGNVTPQTLDNSLTGKIPGVNIRAQSGAPGGGINVQLRGISTLGAGSSQPLYIIDGVYVNNDAIANGRFLTTGANSFAEDNAANRLADLNPEDIASIEVLKGASAAAIYGQRANAGVIIINTKKGQGGATKVSFTQEVGFNSALNLGQIGAEWDLDKIDFVDGTLGFQGTATTDQIRDLFQQAQSNGQFVDMEELLYGREGFINSTGINVSGGDTKTQFYVAGQFSEEDGIIRNTGFDRKSLRLNLDDRISDRVRVASRSSYLRTENDRGFTGNQNGTGASIGYALSATPNFFNPFPDAQGNFPNNPFFNDNPLAIAEQSVNNSTVDRFLQSVELDIELLQKERSSLLFKGSGGLDFLQFNSLVWQPNQLQHQQASANPGDAVRTKEDNLNTNLQAILVFNTQKGDEDNFWDLTSQAGVSRFDTDQSRQLDRAQGLAFGQNNLNQGRVQQVVQQQTQEVIDIGFFAQQEVNWNDKIILTAGARADRSSLNQDQDQYYFYPKASGAFNLTNFDFWKWDTFNQFKLRIAYGETGGLPAFGSTFQVVGGNNIDGNLASTISTRGVDPELDPERSKEIEAGLDFGLFNGKLTFEGSYYRKVVSDLILDLPTARSTGIAAIATNAADLKNTGFELAINATPIQKQNFNWSTTFLWWTNESEITDLSVPAFTTGGFGVSLSNFLIQEGFSPTTIVGTPAVDGESLFTIYGDSEPDFQLSFGNEINFWNNFDFSFLWHWKKGGDNINLSKLLTDVGGTTNDWNEIDEETDLPKGLARLISPAGQSYVEDASYLKLREASLFYTLPVRTTNEFFGGFIERLKFGVTGSNLLLISPYDSYDPETSVFGTQPVNSAVEVTPFPSSRRIIFRLQVDL